MSVTATNTTDSVPPLATVDIPTPAPELSPALQGPPAAIAVSTSVEKAGAVETSKGPGAAPVGEKPAGVPSVEALLAQLKNLPVSQVDALLAAIDAESRPAPAGGEDDGEEETDDDLQVDDSSVSRPREPVRYAEVEPGMQKAIAAVHNHMMEQAVKGVLDKDETLSYNMNGMAPKARESVVTILKSEMERLIDKEGGRFDFDWGRMAQVALNTVKPVIEPFFERPTPRAGMGPGSGSDNYVNQPMAEPKRVPAYADDEDRSAYLMQKLAFEMQQAARETQSQVPGV